MQNPLSRKSSTACKQSTTFSPAEISQSQIINNMETFKVFFACRNVLAAKHHYPEKIQRFFRLQICLSRRSSIPRKYSNCFSPADMSWPQIITIPKTIKDFFACRILLDADHQQTGNIQRLFRLQICLGRRSSIPQKYSKTFSPAELSQPQIINSLEIVNDIFTGRNISVSNYQQHGNIQSFFRLQKCLSRKSSLSRKYSKTFPPAEFSYTQIINNLEIIIDFSAFRFVLAADHRYPESIQRLFRLQNSLRRRSSTTWKYSKILSRAKLSQPQIIDAPEIFKHFFTCRYVLIANNQQLGKIQQLFRLQNSLRHRPSTTWN